ncbi:hypothetical protein [Mycoplasma sp. 'Moose RK']|uniref:hypothetical protein n=1 Tax=Mycoplasma sp. 'Moose RK' TaxID=2780095 RepID=UPI0018C29B51|nr:hypothetical protein [Mycoplasma sp. 'Moose RK']MBG0730553.1 hypothetical protein [Mycoplasma sp. 'Moose RK']
MEVSKQEIENILKSTKNFAKICLIIRGIKFGIGVLFIMFQLAGSVTVVDVLRGNFAISALISVLIISVIWLLLTLTFKILLIVFSFKLNKLAKDLNLKNPHLISKIQGFHTLSIVGIFVLLIDIICLIMIFIFISKSGREIIFDSEKPNTFEKNN